MGAVTHPPYVNGRGSRRRIDCVLFSEVIVSCQLPIVLGRRSSKNAQSGRSPKHMLSQTEHPRGVFKFFFGRRFFFFLVMEGA